MIFFSNLKAYSQIRLSKHKAQLFAGLCLPNISKSINLFAWNWAGTALHPPCALVSAQMGLIVLSIQFVLRSWVGPLGGAEAELLPRWHSAWGQSQCPCPSGGTQVGYAGSIYRWVARTSSVRITINQLWIWKKKVI